MEEEKTLFQKVVDITSLLSKEVIKELNKNTGIQAWVIEDEEASLSIHSDFNVLHISATVVAIDNEYPLVELSVEHKKEIISHEEFKRLCLICQNIKDTVADAAYEDVQAYINRIISLS